MDTVLDAYGRTFEDDVWNLEGLTPFVWSDDLDNSFETFVQCIDAWEEKAKDDESIDLKEKFNFYDFEKETIEDSEAMADGEHFIKMVDRNYLDLYSNIEEQL